MLGKIMIQYIRSHILPSKPIQLLIKTSLKWQQDDCSNMGAALSYYALFSLFPILLMVFSVVGWLIEPNTKAFQYIEEFVKRFLPIEVHDMVRATVIALHQSSTGAGIIGTGLLLYSASTVFVVLNSSVNKIWQSNNNLSEAESIHRTIGSFILKQLLAFLLVLGTSLLLLVSLIANIINKMLVEIVAHFQQMGFFVPINELQLAHGLEFGSSFFILALVTLILFKILPSTHVGWQDIWLGALLSAALFSGLQYLVSKSIISIGSQYLSYGVIGSVMILMLWIYLTCQIFFIGCEFSYVYAHIFGSQRHKPL
jgi:membrane protein